MPEPAGGDDRNPCKTPEMIDYQEDKDVIVTDLEMVFGRVVLLSAYQAEKSIDINSPVVLVMGQEDTPLFLAHLDPVLADIKPLLVNRLEEDGIEVTDTDMSIHLKKDVITKEGLYLIDKALYEALTSGVLSNYQAGAPGYEGVQAYNQNRYEDALAQIASAGAYRASNKTNITQRHF